MFTVTGRLLPDNELYDVQVEDAFAVAGGGWGIVRGNPGALALLDSLAGDQVAPTPTGPFYTLTDADPAAILSALLEHTEVLDVGGDAPDVSGDMELDAKG